ncbi:conserved hypothetical protein [Culex quinquefasciatus]|uniref:Muscleblind-like CCCH zinc finger domain-containing protein n=1 Tax=Culex quinquefasciatus TaxID=7176 RepID=B0W592_CULQU|nr:conserved hypothetical protein [Culex quinquefasciatus]|eukprot:XP_001843876.1 conserved hypothetical protein [Culex quinquefasciatus]
MARRKCHLSARDNCSFEGRCNREKPPCKYFHPPQHLKDQLLINGRNHLALKNAIMQQMGISPGQPVLPGQVPAVIDYSPIFTLQFITLHRHNSSSNSRTLHQQQWSPKVSLH